MSSLIGLLANGVFKVLGAAEVEARMESVSTLYDKFIGHVGKDGPASC
jgi:hypothetical protein